MISYYPTVAEFIGGWSIHCIFYVTDNLIETIPKLFDNYLSAISTTASGISIICMTNDSPKSRKERKGLSCRQEREGRSQTANNWHLGSIEN